jgi:hypothetical protein
MAYTDSMAVKYFIISMNMRTEDSQSSNPGSIPGSATKPCKVPSLPKGLSRFRPKNLVRYSRELVIVSRKPPNHAIVELLRGHIDRTTMTCTRHSTQSHDRFVPKPKSVAGDFVLVIVRSMAEEPLCLSGLPSSSSI